MAECGALIMRISPEAQVISFDIDSRLNWQDAVEALRAGHRLERATVSDSLLTMDNGELLVRSASIKGLGAGVKAVTIYPQNGKAEPPLPTVQGQFVLFDSVEGAPLAVIDGRLLTKWKTVADSLLGTSILHTSPYPRHFAIFGSGQLAHDLIEGYFGYFPSLETVDIWARSSEAAADLAVRFDDRVRAVSAPHEAASNADVICTATAAQDAILKGEWIKPGTHVQLIGAHGPNMREADDNLLQKATLFADNRDTTINEIGEFRIPISGGVISEADIVGDLYDLIQHGLQSNETKEVTVFKNGGGAHLDLMMARYIRSAIGR